MAGIRRALNLSNRIVLDSHHLFNFFFVSFVCCFASLDFFLSHFVFSSSDFLFLSCVRLWLESSWASFKCCFFFLLSRFMLAFRTHNPLRAQTRNEKNLYIYDRIRTLVSRHQSHTQSHMTTHSFEAYKKWNETKRKEKSRRKMTTQSNVRNHLFVVAQIFTRMTNKTTHTNASETESVEKSRGWCAESTVADTQETFYFLTSCATLRCVGIRRRRRRRRWPMIFSIHMLVFIRVVSAERSIELSLSLYLSLSQRVHIVLLYSTAHNNNNNNNRTIRTSPCRYTQGTRQYTITNFRIYINVVVPMTRISSQHECGVYGDRFYNVEYNINIRTFTYNPIQYTLLAVVQFVHTHSVCIPIRSSQRLSQSASHPAIQPQPIKLYRIR